MRLFRKHRHQWRRQHPPLWGPSSGGYFDCAGCDERKVSEPDSYSYVAWPWVQDGTLPPADWLAASTTYRRPTI